MARLWVFPLEAVRNLGHEGLEYNNQFSEYLHLLQYIPELVPTRLVESI